MATNVHEEILVQDDDDGDTVLHTAIILEQTELALSLISIARSNISLSSGNKLSQTPLHLAAILNQPEIVRRLVVAGADLTSQDQNLNTALHIGCRDGNISVVISLIAPIHYNETRQDGCKVNLQSIAQDFTIVNADGLTCLHLAASNRHFNVLELLIKYNADVNMKDRKSERTVLHEACERGDIDMVQFLLKKEMKCDINACTRDGKTACDLARAKGHEDICLAIAAAGKSAHW